jgi:hypothetical protein
MALPVIVIQRRHERGADRHLAGALRKLPG